MLYTKRTVLFPFALVTGWTASVMAVHAVIVDTSAMVGCDIAAKVAFVLNEVLLVLFTI
jgi:hypothetical protein